jgi:hypothetical protein
VKDSGVAELAACRTPSPAGASLPCSCASRSARPTPSSASTSPGWASGKRHRLRLGHRSAVAGGRQGLQLPGAVRPRRQRHGARPGTCWSATRSTAIRLLRAMVQWPERWWDAERHASITSKSFNRYAEWVRLWNAKAARRWILWQIPLEAIRTIATSATTAARATATRTTAPRYFLRTAARRTWRSFADAGVIGLLSAPVAGGQSSTRTTTSHDGQLFMKSRAGAILSAGGVTLARAARLGAGGAGGTAAPRARLGTAGTTGTAERRAGGAAGAPADGAQYNFERARRLGDLGCATDRRASSTARAFAGTHALRQRRRHRDGAETRCLTGRRRRQARHVPRLGYRRAAASRRCSRSFLQGASGNWTWTGSWRAISSLTANAWNTVPGHGARATRRRCSAGRRRSRRAQLDGHAVRRQRASPGEVGAAFRTNV